MVMRNVLGQTQHYGINTYMQADVGGILVPTPTVGQHIGDFLEVSWSMSDN